MKNIYLKFAIINTFLIFIGCGSEETLKVNSTTPIVNSSQGSNINTTQNISNGTQSNRAQNLTSDNTLPHDENIICANLDCNCRKPYVSGNETTELYRIDTRNPKEVQTGFQSRPEADNRNLLEHTFPQNSDTHYNENSMFISFSKSTKPLHKFIMGIIKKDFEALVNEYYDDFIDDTYNDSLYKLFDTGKKYVFYLYEIKITNDLLKHTIDHKKYFNSSSEYDDEMEVTIIDAPPIPYYECEKLQYDIQFKKNKSFMDFINIKKQTDSNKNEFNFNSDEVGPYSCLFSDNTNQYNFIKDDSNLNRFTNQKIKKYQSQYGFAYDFDEWFQIKMPKCKPKIIYNEQHYISRKKYNTYSQVPSKPIISKNSNKMYRVKNKRLDYVIHNHFIGCHYLRTAIKLMKSRTQEAKIVYAYYDKISKAMSNRNSGNNNSESDEEKESDEDKKSDDKKKSKEDKKSDDEYSFFYTEDYFNKYRDYNWSMPYDYMPNFPIRGDYLLLSNNQECKVIKTKVIKDRNQNKKIIKLLVEYVRSGKRKWIYSNQIKEIMPNIPQSLFDIRCRSIVLTKNGIKGEVQDFDYKNNLCYLRIIDKEEPSDDVNVLLKSSDKVLKIKLSDIERVVGNNNYTIKAPGALQPFTNNNRVNEVCFDLKSNSLYRTKGKTYKNPPEKPYNHDIAHDELYNYGITRDGKSKAFKVVESFKLGEDATMSSNTGSMYLQIIKPRKQIDESSDDIFCHKTNLFHYNLRMRSESKDGNTIICNLYSTPNNRDMQKNLMEKIIMNNEQIQKLEYVNFLNDRLYGLVLNKYNEKKENKLIFKFNTTVERKKFYLSLLLFSGLKHTLVKNKKTSDFEFYLLNQKNRNSEIESSWYRRLGQASFQLKILKSKFNQKTNVLEIEDFERIPIECYKYDRSEFTNKNKEDYWADLTREQIRGIYFTGDYIKRFDPSLLKNDKDESIDICKKNRDKILETDNNICPYLPQNKTYDYYKNLKFSETSKYCPVLKVFMAFDDISKEFYPEPENRYCNPLRYIAGSSLDITSIFHDFLRDPTNTHKVPISLYKMCCLHMAKTYHGKKFDCKNYNENFECRAKTFEIWNQFSVESERIIFLPHHIVYAHNTTDLSRNINPEMPLILKRGTRSYPNIIKESDKNFEVSRIYSKNQGLLSKLLLYDIYISLFIVDTSWNFKKYKPSEQKEFERINRIGIHGPEIIDSENLLRDIDSRLYKLTGKSIYQIYNSEIHRKMGYPLDIEMIAIIQLYIHYPHLIEYFFRLREYNNSPVFNITLRTLHEALERLHILWKEKDTVRVVHNHYPYIKYIENPYDLTSYFSNPHIYVLKNDRNGFEYPKQMLLKNADIPAPPIFFSNKPLFLKSPLGSICKGKIMSNEKINLGTQTLRSLYRNEKFDYLYYKKTFDYLKISEMLIYSDKKDDEENDKFYL